MTTVIRSELSNKNKYWIDKHRHYELKHFCLQYPSWKKEYTEYASLNLSCSIYERIPSDNMPSDLTAKNALRMMNCLKKIELVESAAMKTDEYLAKYILKAVTEGLSYTYLKTRLDIPCSKDLYYDRYRKFFWILDKLRE